MHSPDEEAPEEQTKQVVNDSVAQQEAGPLYEFPASPDTRVLPETEANSTPVHEAAAPGFVYPPPPSFYEKIAIPLQQTPLPASRNVTNVPPGGAKVYPAPPAPPFMPQPPVKKSRRWVWIVASIVGAIVLVTCGLCGWGLYSIISPAYQQVAGSIDVVNDYYANLQARNYHAAYSDLAPRGRISGLSEQQFTSQATERDNTYGVVDSFVLEQPGFRVDPNTGPDLSHFTMSVDVKRSHLSYSVALTIAKRGNYWKITDYSQL